MASSPKPPFEYETSHSNFTHTTWYGTRPSFPDIRRRSFSSQYDFQPIDQPIIRHTSGNRRPRSNSMILNNEFVPQCANYTYRYQGDKKTWLQGVVGILKWGFEEQVSSRLIPGRHRERAEINGWEEVTDEKMGLIEQCANTMIKLDEHLETCNKFLRFLENLDPFDNQLVQLPWQEQEFFDLYRNLKARKESFVEEIQKRGFHGHVWLKISEVVTERQVDVDMITVDEPEGYDEAMKRELARKCLLVDEFMNVRSQNGKHEASDADDGFLERRERQRR